MTSDENGKQIIMVCDDDKDLLVLTGETLKSSGYDVFLVNSGKEAIDQLKKWDIDLVVLDVKMAEMHGLDVLKEIRKINSTIPVIIFTSYPQLAGLAEFRILGVKIVVEKGSWGKLEQAIRETLKKS